MMYVGETVVRSCKQVNQTQMRSIVVYLIELCYQLGISFTFLPEQVELLLLVTE